ncbi:MAG: Lacal_2735 family protein [Flavobacteriaceae bacterium]
MFGLFKSKTQKEKLQIQYKKLMKEGYDLQSVNRRASDAKYKEAQDILDQIETLEQ